MLSGKDATRAFVHFFLFHAAFIVIPSKDCVCVSRAHIWKLLHLLIVLCCP
jgi:hypothetical protein